MQSFSTALNARYGLGDLLRRAQDATVSPCQQRHGGTISSKVL
jgi:hypothetical protein